MVRIFLSLLLLLSVQISLGKPSLELIFGPEWTFYNEITSRAIENRQNQNHEHFHFVRTLHDHFEKVCLRTRGCKVDKERSGFFIVMIFEDGFELRLGTDPGVIEVSSTPLTSEEWEKKSAFIQTILFDEMKTFNLVPHIHLGQGHINIGIEYFKNDLLHLRNFIVDFYNHPGFGLMMNSEGENRLNAHYLHQMEKNEREKFVKNIANLDIKNLTFHKLVLAMQVIAEKYVALGIRDSGLLIYPNPETEYTIGPETRLEVRALKPQQDMKSYQLLLEILEARIKFLKENRQPIPLKPLNGSFTTLRTWAVYIEEAGLPLEIYIPLLPSHMQKIPVSLYSSRSGLLNKVKSCFSKFL